MSKYAYLAKPDEEWVTESAKLPPRDEEALAKLSMPEQRKIVNEMLEAARKAHPVVLDNEKVQKIEHKITVEDGSEIRAAAYLPVWRAEKGETAESTFPLLVYYHGGGFALMDIEMEEERLTNLAIASRISVLNVDYRLAPENPFPVGLNDSYTALKWAIANSKTLLKADVSKGLILGGASSGGNFAASLSIMARDDASFPAKVTGQLLQIPVVVSPSARGKYADEIRSPDELGDDTQLSKQTIDKIMESYVQDPNQDHADPRISPLLAVSHKGLPPAFIQISGKDPLRDEAFVYERLLKEAGVPVKVEIYPGVPHGFHAVIPSLAQSKKWTVDVEAAMQWFSEQSRA